MLTDVLQVALAIGAGAVALVLGLALAVRLGRRGTGPPGDPAAWGTAPDPDAIDPDLSDPDVIAAQADELAAHAEHATQQAETATAAVETARQRYAEAERRRAALEADYDAAQARYAEALRTMRAGRRGPLTPEQRDRSHEVSSAALAAYRRGELTVDELRTVFTRAGEWDPEQEARGREAERLAADVGSVRRAYDIAAADTRVAGERLHVAEVAAEATTQEAVDAAVEAQVAADEARRYRHGRR